jgi:hypothetical protein
MLDSPRVCNLAATLKFKIVRSVELFAAAIHIRERNAGIQCRNDLLDRKWSDTSWAMSALGQKRTFRNVRSMSALPPKADIGTQSRDVRFVP